MGKIRVLHVSDLHFQPESSADSNPSIQAILDDLRDEFIAKDRGPHLIIFSGDLAYSGGQNQFKEAWDRLLKPMADLCGLADERIVICPGNHDISRTEVQAIDALEIGFAEKLSTTRAVNEFIERAKNNSAQEAMSLRRLTNFFSFFDSKFSTSVSDHPLIRTRTLSIEGIKVGVAILNSSWRATGEPDDVDYGRLLIGERSLDDAIASLQDSQLRVAVTHHPTDWLAPFDRDVVEPLIRSNFDMLCVGHMHVARPKFVATPEGMCVVSQAGSAYASPDWFNGYQVVEIDRLTGKFEFWLREYQRSRRRYDVATSAAQGGHFSVYNSRSQSTDATSQVELFLRDNRDHLRAKACEHIDFADFPKECRDKLLDDFVPPPLVRRTFVETDSEKETVKESHEIQVADIISGSQDVIIIGERQSGRTSLAFFMATQIAKGAGCQPSIPVWIDVRDYSTNYYGLRKAINKFYEGIPQGFELEAGIRNGLFTFLVDNFDIYDEALLEQFSEHVGSFDANRWILFATPPVDAVSKDRLFNEALPEFDKLHIRPLRRKGIRQLANHWSTGKENARQAFDAVVNQLNHDGLPRTPYMVSLLLWAMHQRKAHERINESMLLANVIDHLLGKADFRQAKRGALNPMGKEIALQELAFYFRENQDWANENDVLEFLVAYFKRKRLPFTASDVLNKLVLCGVLNRSGDTISFKYKCFQEYFIATRFRDSSTELNRFLIDLEFLKVRRELELLSGLRHQNGDLIAFIQSVLASRVPDRFVKSDPRQFDKLTSKGLDRVATQAKLRQIRRTRLSDEELDAIMDEADRRAIARGDQPVSKSLEEAEGDIYEAARIRQVEAIEADSAADGEPLRPGTHMAAIDLLARVVRNSDFTDFDEKAPATKLVLKSWIKILILMLGEAMDVVADIEKQREEKLSDEEKSLVLYLLSKILFGHIGDNVVEQMSSPTMSDTLVDILEEPDVGTGEKMLILFLLEDAHSADWQARWTKLIEQKAASGFVLESFIERLWLVVHRKALDVDQSKRVNEVVDWLEKKLGWTKDRKSAVLQSIRQATNVKRLEEGG